MQNLFPLVRFNSVDHRPSCKITAQNPSGPVWKLAWLSEILKKQMRQPSQKGRKSHPDKKSSPPSGFLIDRFQTKKSEKTECCNHPVGDQCHRLLQFHPQQIESDYIHLIHAAKLTKTTEIKTFSYSFKPKKFFNPFRMGDLKGLKIKNIFSLLPKSDISNTSYFCMNLNFNLK